MELLASNQPWNLLFFMVIPVALAETIAVTELYILFTRNLHSRARTINRWAGIIVGTYFLGVFVYLMNTAFIPITNTGQWRGAVDIIAVGSYLLGVIPLAGIALLEFGFIGKQKNELQKLQLHATFVGLFLIIAHIAMIAGMINPTVFGYAQPAAVQQPMAMEMTGNTMSMQGTMAGMTTGLVGKNANAFDKEFLAEMIMHHQGAVSMANLALIHAQHPELKTLANNIITAQTNEIQMMQQWQKNWFNQ